MNLIVRVKRRRSQEPSESIWIVDDTGAPTKKRSTARQLADSLSALSTSNNEKEQPSGNQKLYLRRIQTVEVGGEAELDKSALSASVSLSQKRGRDEVQPLNRAEAAEAVDNESSAAESTAETKGASNDSSSMWITSGKKVLRSNYTLEKFVVVDVTQIPFTRPSQTTSSTVGKDNNTTAVEGGVTAANAKKSAIIDPATRKLDAAIEKAFKLNDFNEMAQALQIGANINYQRRSDGLTALMVAAMQKNNRMASRLVSKGADVFLRDSDGRTAMDHVKKGHNQSHTGNSHLQNASVEISLLLHRTAVIAQQQASRRQKRSDEEEEAMRSLGEAGSPTPLNPLTPSPAKIGSAAKKASSGKMTLEGEIGGDGEGGEGGEDDMEGDYVVDIFMRPSAEPESAVEGSVLPEVAHVPIVQLEGLHISHNGNVELVFEYDSDWSDLADDEEPDSNDERFAGNDYPEEGEEADREEDEDDDTDDDEKYAMLRADIEDRDEGGHDCKTKSKPTEEEGCMEGLSYGFSGGQGSGRRVNRFNRASVGRVLRPHMMDEGGEGGVMTSGRDPQALQQLWGLTEGGDEDDDYEGEEDDEDDNVAINSKFRSERAEQSQRVRGMRAGTGMQFAANPREFDRSGLPKYGEDLSDGEELEPYDSILVDENKERVGGVSFAVGTKEPDRYGGGYMGGGGSSYKAYNPNSSDSSYSRNNSSSNSGGHSSGNSGSSGGGSGALKKQGGMDRLSMIRNEVRETNKARARGDLTGDLDYYDRNNSNGNCNNNRNSQYGGGGGGHDLFRPLRTTVAYDSDLDKESSDEDNITCD